MNILLTGAAGFVGANVTAALAAHVAQALRTGTPGAHLYAADTAAPGARFRQFLGLLGEHVSYVSLDVRNRQAVGELVAQAGITHIVHAAALTVGGVDEAVRAEEIVDVNLGGSVNVLAVGARAASVVRVLLFSSSGIFGAPRGADRQARLRTQREAGPLDLTNLYSITKYSTELLAARFGELTGKETAVVRLPAVYGPWERPSSSRPHTSTMQRLMDALGAGLPITVAGPRVGRDWTYAPDVGAAVAALLVAPAWRARVYNASCGRAYTFAEVVAAFAEHGLQARWVDDAGNADIAMNPEQARRPLDNRSLRRDAGLAPGSDLRAGLRGWLAVTQGGG